MRQVLRDGALGRPRRMRWRGRQEGGSGWGTHVNPWLIHVSVWQKPLQYCKVISLQLININGKKKSFLKLNGHAQFSRVGGVFLSFLLRIWSRSHMVSPTVLFLCWGVGNRVLLLGAMIPFVQPACLFGPCAARSFGWDSLVCRNAKKIGSLDLSPVMVTSDVHEYFLCLPSGGMLNSVEMWSCSLLLADGIWDVLFLAQESCENHVSAHPATAVFQRVKLSIPPFKIIPRNQTLFELLQFAFIIYFLLGSWLIQSSLN